MIINGNQKSTLLNLLGGSLIFVIQPLLVAPALQKHTAHSVNITLGILLLTLIAFEFIAIKNKMKTLFKNYGKNIPPLFLWIAHALGTVIVMLYGLEAIFGDTFVERSTIIIVAVIIKELVLLYYMLGFGVDHRLYATYKPDDFTYTYSFWKTDFVIFLYSLSVNALLWGTIEANKIITLNAFGIILIFTLSYLASRPTQVYEDILRVNKTKQGGLSLLMSYVFVIVLAAVQRMID